MLTAFSSQTTRCPARVQSPSQITQLYRDAAGKPPDPRLLYDTLTLLMIILHSVIVGHCYGYSTMVQHFAFPFSYSLRPGNHICCLATVLWEYHNLGVTTIKDMMALAYPEGELAWRVVGWLWEERDAQKTYPESLLDHTNGMILAYNYKASPTQNGLLFYDSHKKIPLQRQCCTKMLP